MGGDLLNGLGCDEEGHGLRYRRICLEDLQVRIVEIRLPHLRVLPSKHLEDGPSSLCAHVIRLKDAAARPVRHPANSRPESAGDDASLIGSRLCRVVLLETHVRFPSDFRNDVV
jgi:hypothetical protein